MSRLHKGFTLAELSIVVTIIVLLAVSILTILNPLQQIFKGYDSIRKADLDKIRIAFENYYEDHLCYPGIPPFTKIPATDPRAGQPTYTCDSNILAPYLDKMPCDPNTKKPYDLFVDITIASEKTCPSNIAMYATLTNIFDPAGHEVPVCDNKVIVGNTGVRTTFLSAACYGSLPCSTFYGCNMGTCYQVSVDYPSCSPNYCESDCAGKCIEYPTQVCTPN